MSLMAEAEYRQIINLQRRLPEQLERARRRVRQLESTAKRLGMVELLERRA